MPFPTALIGAYPHNSLAVSIFGAVMALNTLLFMTLQGYILKNLMKPEMVSERDPQIGLKSLVGPASYLLGAAAAWIRTPFAYLFYVITPFFFITPPSKRESRVNPI